MRPKLHEWKGGHCHWCSYKCDDTLHHVYWKGFCEGSKEGPFYYLPPLVEPPVKQKPWNERLASILNGVKNHVKANK